MSRESDLNAIYESYPRHVGSRTAKLAIDRAIRRLMDGEGPMSEADAVRGLLRATCKFAGSPAGQRGGFTPHPATWFNQARYLDDVKEWFNVPTQETFAERDARSTSQAAARIAAHLAVNGHDVQSDRQAILGGKDATTSVRSRALPSGSD